MLLILMHDWIRTSDLFRVKASIHCTFNILQAAGDCQTTRKYAEGGHLTGDFAGEESIGALVPPRHKRTILELFRVTLRVSRLQCTVKAETDCGKAL